MSRYDPTVPNLSPRSTLEALRARRKNPSSPALARGGSDSMSDLMAYGQQLESADGAPMLPESRGNDDDGAAYAPAADAFDAAAGESPSLLQVWLCMLAAMELPIIVHSIATADPLDSDAAERLYTRCVLALLRLLAAAAADRHVLAAVATVHLLELALLGYEAYDSLVNLTLAGLPLARSGLRLTMATNAAVLVAAAGVAPPPRAKSD
ncbi:hypothetical protein EMIHUDRAFT_458588 [Emiliania huxleyi CCMP1516]|uniref:Uncharacterized protein n=2 Tax=Emiliania huxleyi TaxID=2903 RepID=A0A0D3J9S3_EMIH1|nr:hypothetical protein EMIHUDRAFT_458588 [Emiliania huxleyi CCMP1516]EOD20258.1 hypothetical protein EMIHUDRAFT_458588 [Emiliania huxleyi CCMP1516]|eukprot:XP_005772687.1 hypothetical protein EMIHUDRAFT_458588 [Emiliania huxleyi CCMP1516]